MGSDAEVFKLVGPVLLKQEKSEALGNVNKRIDFINNEMYYYLFSCYSLVQEEAWQFNKRFGEETRGKEEEGETIKNC